MWERLTAFERARDSLAASDEASQETRRKASGLRTAFSIRDTRNRWETKAAQYLRGRGTLAQWAAMDPAYSRELAALIDASAPALAEAFDARLSAVAFNAWRNWPKQSGYSRSLIRIAVQQLGPTQFAASVASDAPYTTFISDNPAKKYIVEPTTIAAQRIAEDTGAGIASRLR